MNSLKTLLLYIISLFIIVIGYFSIDFNDLYQSMKGETKYVLQDSNCDLHQTSCEVILQDGTSLVLDIMPKKIIPLKPLKFAVKSNNANLNNIFLIIHSSDVSVGRYTVPLENLGNGKYQSIVTFPSCTVGYLEWNTDIKIEKTFKNLGARFKLKTGI